MAGDLMECEQARVRTGWELVELLGPRSVDEGQRLLAERWAAERARAAESILPLKARPGSEWASRIYESASNRTRFRQTLDFVRPGDRVFEVGPGGGYLAGLLLRDGQIAAYHGIDLQDAPVRRAREFLEINGLADRAEVSKCNLYDLTRADVEKLGITLLVCCEVLEHVPDPERAMKTLAYVLPAGADLLISVPLLGRLEQVWGHVAIFDTNRIRRMVEESGLVAHSVQVIDNQWVLVLASHGPGPSSRAPSAAAAAVDVLADRAPDPNAPTAFHALDLGVENVQPSVRNEGLSAYQLEAVPRAGLACELTAKRSLLRRRTGYGGVRLPVSSPRGLRIEVSLDAFRAVREFYVDAYAADKRVARWRWDTRAHRPRKDQQTFVLRPGRENRQFKEAVIGDLESADAFDVFVAVRSGASARFRLTRAAVVV